MKSRWARPEERAALQALWERVFGDVEDVTGAFFRRFPPERHTRVIEADGSAASMASWLPVTLRTDESECAGAYIYAVATAREYRGRGFARALLEALEQALKSEGLAFAALCPAERSLYDYYGAMGYEPAFSCNLFECRPEGEGLPLTSMDAMQYRAAREARLIPPFCRWDGAALSYLADTGARFYGFPGGCAAVNTLPDGKLRVSELIADDARTAAAGLCTALGASGAEVFTPGIEQPRGMLKWFIFGQKISRIHLGFAFD